MTLWRPRFGVETGVALSYPTVWSRHPFAAGPADDEPPDRYAPRLAKSSASKGSIMMHSPGHSSAASTAASMRESGIRATP